MVTIKGDLTSIFDKENFERFLMEKNAEKKSPSNQYINGLWKIGQIQITLYTKTVVIQGKENDYNNKLIELVCKFDGISLNQNNRTTLMNLFPSIHNGILCENCNKVSHLIKTEFKELQCNFHMECTHILNLNHSITMINNRLLPDINILISHSLSRLMELDNFNGFEIIIPGFLLNVVDTIDGAKKNAVSDEIERIIKLQHSKNIIVKQYSNSLIKFDEEKIKNEDDYIIELSDITNSILITSDNNMKTKATLNQRPVIFIPASYHENIRTLHSTRR